MTWYISIATSARGTTFSETSRLTAFLNEQRPEIRQRYELQQRARQPLGLDCACDCQPERQSGQRRQIHSPIQSGRDGLFGRAEAGLVRRLGCQDRRVSGLDISETCLSGGRDEHAENERARDGDLNAIPFDYEQGRACSMWAILQSSLASSLDFG